MKPGFLITIDTEGDNEWSYPRVITTHNAAYLPRFQSLCESYGLKPTYLTNYEMAQSSEFQQLGREALKRRTAEIGMHLHPWSSPPLHSLTDDDLGCHPYLIEYPVEVMREKITCLTDLLEATFQDAIVSHRAGRWAFDERYARLLVDRGYLVDCSVTPNVSWRQHGGTPGGTGGSDFTHFPSTPYFVDLDDISRPGSSPLFEVPMTIVHRRKPLVPVARFLGLRRSTLAQRIGRRLAPIWWLRPNGRNADAMIMMLREAVSQGRGYAEMMLHSSELMPGCNPTFRNDAAIEKLYQDLATVFQFARDTFVGLTLKEYRQIAIAGATI